MTLPQPQSLEVEYSKYSSRAEVVQISNYVVNRNNYYDSRFKHPCIFNGRRSKRVATAPAPAATQPLTPTLSPGQASPHNRVRVDHTIRRWMFTGELCLRRLQHMAKPTDKGGLRTSAQPHQRPIDTSNCVHTPPDNRRQTSNRFK